VVGGLAVVGGTMVVAGTLVEDVATGGIGIADDPATIATGGTLIGWGFSSAFGT
jgi:hypothetical protein